MAIFPQSWIFYRNNNLIFYVFRNYTPTPKTARKFSGGFRKKINMKYFYYKNYYRTKK